MRVLFAVCSLKNANCKPQTANRCLASLYAPPCGRSSAKTGAQGSPEHPAGRPTDPLKRLFGGGHTPRHSHPPLDLAEFSPKARSSLQCFLQHPAVCSQSLHFLDTHPPHTHVAAAAPKPVRRGPPRTPLVAPPFAQNNFFGGVTRPATRTHLWT